MKTVRLHMAVALAATFAGTLAAHAADDLVEHHGAQAWVVTVGGWGLLKPDYEGSDDYELAFKPIFNVRREGSREWLALPEDSAGFALIERQNFRFGPAFNLREEREAEDDIEGLDDVDWTFEAGAFVEYWPVESFRTRAEFLQAVNGHDGFLVNLSADGVWRPAERWLLTAGLRGVYAGESYRDAYFSVDFDDAVDSGLPVFEADGGFHSIGAGVSATYDWTPNFATKLYAEYDHLLGDAADSPIVDERGSEDQFVIGVGATYKFRLAR